MTSLPADVFLNPLHDMRRPPLLRFNVYLVLADYLEPQAEASPPTLACGMTLEEARAAQLTGVPVFWGYPDSPACPAPLIGHVMTAVVDPITGAWRAQVAMCLDRLRWPDLPADPGLFAVAGMGCIMPCVRITQANRPPLTKTIDCLCFVPSSQFPGSRVETSFAVAPDFTGQA